MNTQEITIQGQTFKAPAPYAEGHTINAAEASVLNQTLAENLRNNFAAKMKRAAEDKENPKILTQEDFDKYAQEYKFGVRPIGTRTPTDPVRAEAERLAKAAITKALTAKGHKVKDLPDGRMAELVAEALEKHPKFMEQAKTIVDARAGAVADLVI